jgi:N-acetylneuraminate synthase
MHPIEIDGRRISPEDPPYVIAELSANHGGSLERARRIIEIAARSGADAIKFQAYTADELTIDSDRQDFVITADNPWKGERLYRLYESAATPYDWFPELFAHARALGITPFASVFSAGSIDALERLQVGAYKIASFEAVDLELIGACAATGKPVIISTGICELDEMAQALDAARKAGGRQVALLRCNSTYPADPAEANLLTIADMIHRFDAPIGYSDHTLTALQAIVAVGLGASIVEKHLIDAREPPTADSSFSCLPDQFDELVQAVRTAHLARGAVFYGASSGERKSIVFRRSLYAVSDIAAGEAFTRDNVRSIRPGYGLKPNCLPKVLSGVAARSIKRGEPLSWELVK